MTNNQIKKMPFVKAGDWINIGKSSLPLSAVVCSIFDKDSVSIEGDIEVVYLDDRNRAINEDVIWAGDCWEFKINGPNGGYADRYDRLKEYVGILRRGR